jgi:hypothetical protein
LRIDLDATVRAERLTQYPPVLQQSLGVCLGTEFKQQLGRALDVGEKKGDGPDGRSRISE